MTTTKKENRRAMAALVVALALWDGAANAQVAKCRPDQVMAGSICIDEFEATLWNVPNPDSTNAALVRKIRRGTASLIDLFDGGALQLGTVGDDYPCADSGQNCDKLFAVVLDGEYPSAYVTWFQAQQACKNSFKRLPTNAEWQLAVAGTPDPGIDDDPTDCNTGSSFAVKAAGNQSACVSSWRAYDMVGNLGEWVADWVPASTACPGWGAFSNDFMCLSGASTTATAPDALIRGGVYASFTAAGPLAILTEGPQTSHATVGVRCAR